MGDTGSLTARDRAIAQVRTRYPDCSSLGIGWMLDAIDADTYQDLHDERRLADIEASVAESDDPKPVGAVLGELYRALTVAGERQLRRHAAVREAAEGPGGDPFGGFPR